MVCIVPEAATILIKEGHKPGSVGFQIAVANLILEYEREALKQAKRNYFNGQIFILCDRTLLDGNGYVTDEEFGIVLRHIGMDNTMITKRYDAIIYFESAAKGASGYFGKQSNDARYENIPEAVETCDRTWQACSKHPHIAKIYNDGGTFSQKLFYAYQQLCRASNISIPLSDTSAQRYYVTTIDKEMLISLATAAVTVEMYYLASTANYHKPERLRSKTHNGVVTYFHTRERQTGSDEYTQIEKVVDKATFNELKLRHNPTTKVIHKTLYSFEREGLIYELNLYNEPIMHNGIPGVGILKITPTKANGEIKIPEALRPMTQIPLKPKELTDYMIACQ